MHDHSLYGDGVHRRSELADQRIGPIGDVGRL
jgi:hypothetical protein